MIYKLKSEWSKFSIGVDYLEIEATSLEEAISKANKDDCSGKVTTEVHRCEGDCDEWEENDE